MSTTATVTQTTIPATVNQESSGVLSGWLAGVMSQLPQCAASISNIPARRRGSPEWPPRTGVQEGASEPSDWDADDIRSTWTRTVG